MSKFWEKYNFGLLLIIFASWVIFLPGLFVYFSQDDFIHLSHSQNFKQVISAFNIFQKGEFPFYRPIPTQVYFYFGQKLFSLNPLGYHFINLGIFTINIIVVFRLLFKISNKRKIATLGTLFFAINSTHFAPLNSPAYVHELFFVLFAVLTVDFFIEWITFYRLRNYFFAILFFIFALMSKETSVILPLILVLIIIFLNNGFNLKKIFLSLTPFFSMLAIYLIGHFFYYGLAKSPSYQMILGSPTVNIFFWYILWALSTPNILIDFFGPGFKINQVFFQVAKISGWIYVIFFPLFVLFGIIISLHSIFGKFFLKKIIGFKFLFLGLLWFTVGLLPLIIYPLHKLATQQAFSLVGLSLFLGTVLCENIKNGSVGKILSFIFISIYLLIAVNSVILARKTHWIITSSKQSDSVIKFFKNTYPNLQKDAVIYFENGKVPVPEYGSSRQIYQALGDAVGLKLVLNKDDLNLYFEDINPLPEDLRNNTKVIRINSSDFLGY